MGISKWSSVFLVVFLALLGLTGPAGYAQDPDAAEAEIQQDRVHLRPDDWKQRAKAQSAIRVEEAVRLREGAATGRITSAPIELPFAVNGVGPHWDATVPEAAVLDVEVRVSPNGTDWTSWVAPGHRTRVPATGVGTQRANTYAGDTAGGLVLVEPDTRYVQVRLTLQASADASPVLRRLSLYVANATDGPAPPSHVTQKQRPGGAPDTSKPDLSTRDEWDARAPATDYRYYTASHLAIHHTATASYGAADTWEDCAAGVRAIQDYHMDTNGWIDIGYNYLICQTGDIFQGREDGDDSHDVVGAHDGYNDGSVGTAALGYFHPPENQKPTSALINGYVDLFGWIAARRDIDPDGTSRYVDYGSLRNVYGHRDVKATACPGDHLYSKRSAIVDSLGGVVSDTSDESDPPEKTLLSESRPNPVRSRARFDLQLSRGGVVTITVYDLLGQRVVRRRYGYYKPGTHTISLRTAEWAAGTYPYRLVVDERSRTGMLRVVR
ncbi:MAG: N-acetylmuramoyl-L-alanine amidase [Salinibacter sp.]